MSETLRNMWTAFASLLESPLVQFLAWVGVMIFVFVPFLIWLDDATDPIKKNRNDS